MENLTSSPVTSESSSGSIHDPPGYIKPSLQDLLLTDITADELLLVAQDLGVEYLSPASIFPASFPADGIIYGLNRRLMINLACRRQSRTEQPTVNIIFMVDTGSPVSYLSASAMEALIGNPGSHIPQHLVVKIHSEIVIRCNLSPPDKHFADVSVLGMDFLSKNHLSLSMDYNEEFFQMVVLRNYGDRMHVL
jgi:hypothetical protein